MTPMTAERTAPAVDLMRFILTHLSGGERNKFARQFSQAARHGDDQLVQRLIESWSVTIEVREHPDYQPQYEAVVALVESGELFKGTPFEGGPLPEAI